MRDPVFRQELTARLQDLNQAEAADLIPGDRPVPNDWEIVFALMDAFADAGPGACRFSASSTSRFRLSDLRQPGFAYPFVRFP